MPQDLSLPVVIGGKGFRRLVPSDLETRLLGARLYTKGRGWSERALKAGVVWDLSRVEWADLGAIVHILVVVESALRDGLRVKIALPLTRHRRSEVAWVDSVDTAIERSRVQQRVDRRAAVRSFLEHVQFNAAASPDHLGPAAKGLLEIDSEYDPSDAAAIEDANEAGGDDVGRGDLEHEEQRYRYCFPLKWLSSAPTTEAKLAQFLAGILGTPQRGLEVPDAALLANVVFHELLDNISRHAETSSHGLVAAWARPGDCPPIPIHALECERPYLSWVAANETPILELVIGDSGVGIPQRLAPAFDRAARDGWDVPTQGPNQTADVLYWAFHRWSTSGPLTTERGTRGLYRVHRVVQKYLGLVTLRCEASCVGWDHGGDGFASPVSQARRLSRFRGTLVRLRLRAFRGSALAPRREGSAPEEQPEIVFRNLGAIEDHGLGAAALAALQRLPSQERRRCVVGVVEGGSSEKTSIEAALRQAVRTRHPASLVLCGLPGSWDYLETIVDSLNSEHKDTRKGDEARGREAYEVWDPVLLLGPEGQTAWVGATEDQRTLLSGLSHSASGLLSGEDVRTMIPAADRLESARRQFAHDQSLVGSTPDGGLQLRIGPAGIAVAVGEKLRSLLEAAHPSVLRGAFVTPALAKVNTWITDLGQVMQGVGGLTLVMQSLADRIGRSRAWHEHGPGGMVVSGSIGHPEALDCLARSLSIRDPPVEIPPESTSPLPVGAKVAVEGKRVLVYVDVIHTGDTATRCVKEILRGGGIPMAVACLVDGRTNPAEPILAWGTTVDVVSLCSLDLGVPGNASNWQMINPGTRLVERPSDALEFHRRLGPAELASLCERHAGLRFGHFERPVGRHFTSFVDARGLVGEEAILAAFRSEMTDFLDSGGSETGTEVWYPLASPRLASPAKQIAEALGTSGQQVLVRAIRRDPVRGRWHLEFGPEGLRHANVVVVDWGAITGTTLSQMVRLAAAAGARMVLVCVLFSQMPADDEAFLTSLRTFAGVPAASRSQRAAKGWLPGFGPEQPSEDADLPTREVPVRVVFLSALPFAGFEPHHCPACQRLASLPQGPFPTALLAGHVARLQDFLRARSVRTDPLATTDPALGTLPPGVATQLLRWHEMLGAAVTSTAQRARLAEAVSTLAQDVGRGGSVGLEARSLLRLLAIEAQWLRHSPLRLRPLRSQLAELAAQTALTEGLPDIDRLLALLVLRASSKQRFLAHLSPLLEATHDRPLLLGQILLDLFTYVCRPYHRSEAMLRPFITAVSSVIGAFDDRRTHLPSPAVETLLQLQHRAQTRLHEAQAEVLSPAESWARAKSELGRLYAEHGPVYKSILFLKAGPYADIVDQAFLSAGTPELRLSDLRSGVRDWLASLEGHWLRCCQFIDFTLVPLLKRTRSVFDGVDAQIALGLHSDPQFLALLDGRVPLAESEVYRTIAQLSAAPALSRPAWDVFRKLVVWLYDVLLKAADPSVSHHPSLSQHPSRLIAFLAQAPVQLDPVVRRECAAQPEGSLGGPYDLQVASAIGGTDLAFATHLLVRDSLGEALANCAKHRRSPGDTVNIRVSLRSEGNSIVLSVLNDKTEEGADVGRGLVRLRERLEAFGGSLRTQREGAPWSYRLEAVFVRGV